MLGKLNKNILIIYGVISIALLNTITNVYILNANNGINYYYQYTMCLFNINTLIILILLVQNRMLLPTCTMIIIIGDVGPLRLTKYINYAYVNVGLSNVLSQYHPPLFFLTVFIIFQTIKKYPNASHRILIPNRTGLLGLNYLIVSLLLSGWWASQELFWGSFWNWDPVELSSTLLVICTLGFVHSAATTALKTTVNAWTDHFIFAATLLAMYTINRSELANSIHKFSGTFLLKIDKTWFYCIKNFIFVTLYFVFFKKKIYTEKNKHNQLLMLSHVTYLIIATVVYNQVHIYLNITSHNLFQFLANTTFVIITCIIRPNKYFTKIPKTAPHLLISKILLLPLLLNYPPTNQLYTKKIKKTICYFFYTENNCSLSHGSFNKNIFYVGFRKKKQKNEALLSSYNDVFTKKVFFKYNNDTLLFNLDTNDLCNTPLLIFLK